jgi:hypothetical protein
VPNCGAHHNHRAHVADIYRVAHDVTDHCTNGAAVTRTHTSTFFHSDDSHTNNAFADARAHGCANKGSYTLAHTRAHVVAYIDTHKGAYNVANRCSVDAGTDDRDYHRHYHHNGH